MQGHQVIINIATNIANMNGQCFFVGGYVRDKLLGIDSHDIDIECFGISYQQLLGVLQQYGHPKEMGKSFGIIKLLEFPQFDFALPRTESAIGLHHTSFQIDINPALTYYQAASRRDFTCNAILQNILTLEHIDPFNGITDIKSHILRHVNDTTFVEDQLRGLRAAQFAGRFNFTLANETITIIRSMNYSHLSIERIQQELYKGLMHSQKISHYFSILQLLQIDVKLFPPSVHFNDTHFLQTIDAVHMQLNTFLAKLIVIQLYQLPEQILSIFSNEKKLVKMARHIAKVYYHLAEIITPYQLRTLKYDIVHFADFWNLLTIIHHFKPEILAPEYHSVEQFYAAFQAANNNNPSPTPLVQGRDLLANGFTDTLNFSNLLQECLELELEGLTKVEILNQLKSSQKEVK